MPQESHDHNFKNVFLDFPRESLELFYPQALEQYGELQEITFVRQEPRKHRLSDSALALDMPILFRFVRGAVLLWLVEFQEDISRFFGGSVSRLVGLAGIMINSKHEIRNSKQILMSECRND